MSADRHNRLRGSQPALVAAIAVVAGALAATAGLHPTGARVVDVLLVAAAAAAVTWAAASAPWWTMLVAAGLAAAIADGLVWMALGLAGALLVFSIGLNERSRPWGRSITALAAIEAFAHTRSFGPFGTSSVIALVTLSMVFVLGVRRRPRKIRTRVWRCVGGATAAAALAVAAVAIAGLGARAPLEEGNRQVRSGLDALNRGDVRSASAALRAASDAFGRADHELSAVWAQPSRLVPVVAQHRDAIDTLSARAAAATSLAADALQGVDPGALRMVNGKVDIAAVSALAQPFSDLTTAIVDIASAIDDVRSPWLVSPLQHRLTALDKDVVRNIRLVENASLAVRAVPGLLGAQGPRHYFVAFTTPSESRGLGGFMGNYAELTIDNGHLSLSAFGRHGDLDKGGQNPAGKTVTGPADFLQQWARFGFVDRVTGTMAADAWGNVTMAPDFPSVAKVIAELYPQSGGRQIDGVFAIDPQVMADLVGITGPIHVDGIAKPLTKDNLVPFILKDQYQLSASTAGNSQRIELLDVIAHSVVEKLLSSALPAPADLAKTFGPLARQDRLMAWSTDAGEEALFQRIGMDGAFPTLNGADGLAVTTDNSGGNKIDSYLKIDVRYDAVEPSGASNSGATTATATVTLTNSAPASGLPDYVIGNSVGQPEGTNHTFLTVYSALAVEDVTLDGQPGGMEYATVFGWHAASMFVDVPPGGSRTLKLTLRGSLATGPYRFVTRTQPFAVAQTMTTTLNA